jgi:hypothetical protein
VFLSSCTAIYPSATLGGIDNDNEKSLSTRREAISISRWTRRGIESGPAKNKAI